MVSSSHLQVGADADELGVLKRRLERARSARLEAEAIAESGMRVLYEREQQLRLLQQIATAANESQSVKDVLQFALTRVCEFTGWSLGHAYIAHQTYHGVRLRSSAIWRANLPRRMAAFRRKTESIEFAPGVGLPGRVYASGAAEWVIDVAQDNNFPRRAAAAQCGLKAACAFPVMVGEDVTAVLEFFTEQALKRDGSLLEIMSQVGTQLGRVMERKRAEERLMYDASHDLLTKLPNRALFCERLGQAIARNGLGRGTDFAVLFIDLDRFKMINDSLGHLAGDKLIVEVAARLQASFQTSKASDFVADPSEMLARIGGDEFTILLTNLAASSDAVRRAEQVGDSLRQPFNIDGHELYTSASIGIASSASGYACADDILRDADLAMYRAKALGKDRCELFDDDMHRSAMERLTLDSDLRRALPNNEFVLHYQPIVALETLEVVGFEALVRWQKPGGTLIYPTDFIGLAEETGFIVFIGTWVLREACRTMRALQAEFPRETPLTISVNISPRQFAQPDLVAHVRRIIAETGIDPRTVRLEITESVTIGDAELVARILTELKEIGVRLSIDDFGTGYSSLSYLHRLPLDTLKIDRSFISAMNGSEEGFQIIHTIMSLARNLGMDVIAEGTELEGQVERLAAMGCDFGQGHYFSKALDSSGLSAFLKSPPDWRSALGLKSDAPNWHRHQRQKLEKLASPMKNYRPRVA